MQPHHHVAAWAVCALITILMAVLSANIATTSADKNSDGPSESTKKFFGAEEEDEGGDYGQPAECEGPREGSQQGPSEGQSQQSSSQYASSDIAAKVDALSQEAQGLTNELAQYQARDFNTMTVEDKSKMTSIQSRVQAINTEISSLTSNSNQSGQGQSSDQTQMSGPSDACKAAMAKMMVSHMETFASKMDSKFLPVIDRVTSVTTKITANIPGLKTAGVTDSDITAIEKDIATINKNAGIMRSFFIKMRDQMREFVAQAKSDPANAFSVMEKMNDDQSQFTAASNAADEMVKTFTSLEATIDKIANATPAAEATASPATTTSTTATATPTP